MDEVDRELLETCLAHTSGIIACEEQNKDVLQCADESESFSTDDLERCCGYHSHCYYCNLLDG